MPRTLSIVIPAYNEERFIGTLLDQIRAVDLAPLGVEKQIIVVDDCSRDRTAEIVSRVPGVVLQRMPANGGKGRAVRAGIAMATGLVFARFSRPRGYRTSSPRPSRTGSHSRRRCSRTTSSSAGPSRANMRCANSLIASQPFLY